MPPRTLVHFTAKANRYSRSVRNTRSGVIGRRLRRMPAAWATAFEIAGAMPTMGGSPMPLAPNGPSSSGSSTSTHARGQDERIAPALHREVQRGSVRDAGAPSPQERRLQEFRKPPPMGRRPHQRHGRQAYRSPDSGDEASGHRIGDEAHQIRESKARDQETAHSGRHRAQHERPRGIHEQSVALCIHRGSDRGHDDDERGRESRNRAAKAARAGDDQAGGEVPEQHQADALGGVRSERPGEYEAPEGDLGDEQPQARGEAGRQRRNGLGGPDVRTQLGGQHWNCRFHRLSCGGREC